MAVKEPTRDGKIIDGKIELSTALWDTSLEMPPRQDANEVDARDANTPDKWVYRHPEMLRNTGVHPFNSEPPMKNLQEAGWITPPSLHVVRNHGAVPQLKWSEHKLKITGVPKPCELSMDQIASGDFGTIVSIPVTFICAGNRRKEQNMTKKTVGFDWGPGAVGNSIWTGVRLCELLAHLGITRPTKECRYVHFEGPLGELPQGKTGSYGTSIDLGWALDRERDVLLAFKQNGELLTPDHGAPLRTLLPGCIGGRMIKWLTSMWVSDQPSENHYHYFDNRVLPPHVDADLAYAEGWWYKPEYIINHMNINSAMFEPRHMSYVTMGQESTPSTVKVCGYAYTGGGHKIIRAEISLDSGKCWELTDLTRPEDDIAAARGTDKHWCWSWWETEVDLHRLESAEEICCRAWDSNHNGQPVQLTWTVMGMLNNPIYRVKIHREKDKDGQDMIWFEHPTQGSNPGGWMTDAAGQFNAAVSTPSSPGPNGVSSLRPPAAVWKGAKEEAVGAGGAKKAVADELPKEAGKFVKSTPEWLTNGIPMSEVKKHDNDQSCWFVVKNRVYDGTSYLEDHPGGASSMLLAAGLEATEDFEAVHSSRAWDMLKDYYMGPLKEEMAKPQGNLLLKIPSIAVTFAWRQVFGAFGLVFGTAAAVLRRAIATPVFLNPKETQQLQLLEKIQVSHDTRIFRFALPSKSMRLGLPTGMHMILKAKVDSKPVMRAYTPMTDDSTKGHVDLLVKVYFKGVHPKFPEGGKMSQHLESLKIGDSIEVKGPVGEFVYKGRGHFTWHGQPRFCKEISMIAGGTGLTPCYQVLAAIMRDPQDTTRVNLLYANKSADDILAREILEKLAAENPKRFSLHLTVDSVASGEKWNGHVGFVNAAMTRSALFEAGPETICAMCGPPVMLEKACHPALAEMGYDKKNIFEF